MAKIWDILWAAGGDKITIPEPAQAGGEVSVTTGWTPDYELPDTDPDYKPVGRDEMNGALNEITDSIQQLQSQGAAEWHPSLAPYVKGAEVIHSGERWYNPVAGNSTEPGAAGHIWVLAGSVPDASETIKGIIRLSTALEAQGLSLNTAVITPLSLNAAFKGANQLLGASGFQKLPGGLIIQGGQVEDTATAKNFPVAFPNGIIAIVATSIENAFNASASATVFPNGLSQFYAREGSGSNPGKFLYFIALGY